MCYKYNMGPIIVTKEQHSVSVPIDAKESYSIVNTYIDTYVQLLHGSPAKFTFLTSDE